MVMLVAGVVAFVCQSLAFGAVTPLWWVSPLLAAMLVSFVARHV